MPRKTHSEKKSKIISMYNLGSTVRDIATACNTTADYVNLVIKEYNNPEKTFDRRENLLK